MSDSKRAAEERQWFLVFGMDFELRHRLFAAAWCDRNVDSGAAQTIG